MPVRFECPYCGSMLSDSDDIEFLRSHRTCPECEAAFDEEELEDLLPEEGEDGEEYEEEEPADDLSDDQDDSYDDDSDYDEMDDEDD